MCVPPTLNDKELNEGGEKTDHLFHKTGNYETILVDENKNLGRLIYNQPEIGNPMTLEMTREAKAALTEFLNNDEIRVVILGHTGKTFISGVPFTEFVGKNSEEIKSIVKEITEYRIFLQRDFTKPIIAVADGYAGGVQDADIAIISDRSKYAHPAINVGFICGSIVTGARVAGYRRNRRLILTGELIDAQKALEWGFVDEVVPPDRLEGTAIKFADILAKKSPQAMSITKKAFWETRDMPSGVAAPYIEDLFCKNAASKAGQEGIKAFMEKRQPAWVNLEKTL